MPFPQQWSGQGAVVALLLVEHTMEASVPNECGSNLEIQQMDGGHGLANVRPSQRTVNGLSEMSVSFK
jgi:hypothetical protein